MLTLLLKGSPPAGAIFWIKVAGTWKQATTYEKVAGTWKLATPYIKESGTWK
jgi:hypothetical protein